jgi:hypothetical protein
MKKKITPILIMLVVAFQSFAQLSYVVLEEEPKISAMALMSIDESVFDFGEISKDEPANHEFLIHNEGDAPLIISEVKTSCGCTASDFSKKAIAPGESGFVLATYNAAKEGSFNKSLRVTSNGGEQTLFIKGKVQ